MELHRSGLRHHRRWESAVEKPKHPARHPSIARQRGCSSCREKLCVLVSSNLAHAAGFDILSGYASCCQLRQSLPGKPPAL